MALADSSIYHAGVGQADRLVADPVDGPLGVLAPPGQAAGHALVRAAARTECLLDAEPETMLRVRVRWLQLTTRAEDDPADTPGAEQPPWLADVRGGALGRGRPQARRVAYIPHDLEERVPLWVLLAARPPPPPRSLRPPAGHVAGCRIRARPGPIRGSRGYAPSAGRRRPAGPTSCG